MAFVQTGMQACLRLSAFEVGLGYSPIRLLFETLAFPRCVGLGLLVSGDASVTALKPQIETSRYIIL